MTEKTLDEALKIQNRINQITTIVSGLRDYLDTFVRLAIDYGGTYSANKICLLNSEYPPLNPKEDEKVINDCTHKYFKELESELEKLKNKYKKEFEELS